MTRPIRVLIAGSSGQVATELQRRLAKAGYSVIALGRPQLDLAHAHTFPSSLGRLEFDVVVNAAAYTSVDKAEDEPELAQAINVIGAGALAAMAADVSIPMIHISTDYVFDGTKCGAYLETDPTIPLGVYGRTKLEGERRVAAINPRHVILRTSWVFSAHGHNFVKTILRLGRERSTIQVVDDQYGCPTAGSDLADTIGKLIPNIIGDRPSMDAYGVFHATGQGSTTWCDFARAIMAGAARRGAASAEVVSINSSQYPTRARRPRNSVLDASRLRAVHGIAIPPWQNALEITLDELLADQRHIGDEP